MENNIGIEKKMSETENKLYMLQALKTKKMILDFEIQLLEDYPRFIEKLARIERNKQHSEKKK